MHILWNDSGGANWGCHAQEVLGLNGKNACPHVYQDSLSQT